MGAAPRSRAWTIRREHVLPSARTQWLPQSTREGGTMRLLIIDEDQKAAHMLAKGLRDERFVVDIAHTAAAGAELATVNTYDLIVLGWVLPDQSGITVCGDLRTRGIGTPIVMVTSRDSLENRVTGLNAGADDYLARPFAFGELLARIR